MEGASCSYFEEQPPSPREAVLQQQRCDHETSPSGLKIAEVRKSLAHIRKRWDSQLLEGSAPMYLCEEIGLKDGRAIRADEFALKFVLAHHQKRRDSSARGALDSPAPPSYQRAG
jgi:hypothetical protein